MHKGHIGGDCKFFKFLRSALNCMPAGLEFMGVWWIVGLCSVYARDVCVGSNAPDKS